MTQGFINNLTQVTADQIQRQTFISGSDTGIADAYAVALTPAISSYNNFQSLIFMPANANTLVNPTVALNGLAPITVLLYNGSPLQPGDMAANIPAVLNYAGGNFYLQNPQISDVAGANFPVNNNITSMIGLTDWLQAPLGFKDSSGNKLLENSYIPAAVNYFTMQNNATGSAIALYASGTDANVSMQFNAKGAAPINLYAGSGINFYNDLSEKILGLVPAASAVNNVTIASAATAAYPYIAAEGTDTNIYLALLGKGTSGVSIFGDTNLISDITGHTIASFTTTPSAVNYITFVNNTTGFPPAIYANGSDTDIGLTIVAKGAGAINLVSESGATNLATFSSTPSAVNYVDFINNITTANPAISAVGSDTNITLQLGGKGTGGVYLVGVSTNSAAVTGQVGEFVSSVIGQGSSISLTNNTSTNLTSISLTAGDWDVWGNILNTITGLSTQLYGWISSTSATFPDGALVSGVNIAQVPTTFGFCVPSIRFSLSATTTIYISGYCSFTTGTAVLCGGIYARRVR